MEGWLIMFALPAGGAYVLRATGGRLWAFGLWAFLCICSVGVMVGAGWSGTSIAIMILVASFLGGFAAEILGGIGAVLAQDFRGTIIAVAVCIALFFVGRAWMLGDDRTHRNIVQGGIVLIVFGGLAMSRFGSAGGGSAGGGGGGNRGSRR